MREISRIFKGTLGVQQDVINKPQYVKGMKSEVLLVGLWRHECERVFVDKLVNSKDKDMVMTFIQ